MSIQPNASGVTDWRRLWLPVLLILVSVWARSTLPWSPAPLDVDEALYSTYARQISHENNPMLREVAIDKPPMVFYLTALSFKLFTNPSDWAARLPSFYAGVLTTAAVWALARRLYHNHHIAATAALIFALSPLDAAFAGTAFTDPLATFWLALALLSGARRSWGRAGLLAGFAFATKQSSIQFAPLVVMLGLVSSKRLSWRGLLRLGAAFSVSAALPVLWDWVRAPRVSYWELGAANNMPDRFIRSDELLPRLATWANHLMAITGSEVLAIFLLLSAAILAAATLRHRTKARTSSVDLTLAAYALGYVLVYWLGAFNTYNRYAHTWAILIVILLARGVTGAANQLRAINGARRQAVAYTLVAVLMLPNALATRAGATILNEAQHKFDGIKETAAYMNQLPPGTIVYDHWLDWELNWYTRLNQPPGMWLRLTYYHTPEEMVRDALLDADPNPRYLVTPDWENSGPWLSVAKDAGFLLKETAAFGRFTIVELTTASTMPSQPE